MKGDNSAMLGKVSAISDDNRLFEIFKGCDDFEIRYAIVNRIGDDGILYEIFSAEENPFIKSIALNRISTDILDCDDFNSLDGYEKINYIEKCNDETLFYRVAQNDSDFYVRAAAVYRISDTDLLLKMAERHADYDTRVVCYKKLSGQSVMEEITGENLTESRLSLIKSLDNDEFLKDILINDRDWDVQLAALKRLIEDDFYFTLLKNALNYDDFASLYEKISFIEKASDESELFELAENDESFYVRAAAINKISDWDFLSKMADTHTDYDTRFVLYKKLNGRPFLDEITEENLVKSHKSLVKRLDNENFLKDIAVNDYSFDVKVAALKKLDKPDFYFTIMNNTLDGDELRQLIGDIRDESQLFDLAVFDSSKQSVVENAINNIADPSLLFELYRTGRSLVRKTAMKKLVFGNVFSRERIADNISIDRMISSVCSKDVLVDIAMNDSSQISRENAVRRIGDEDILIDIARNNSDDYVRKVAVDLISNADVLADIAMNDSDYYVQEAAVGRISNADVLANIAMNNSNSAIRRLAARKIGRRDILIEIAENETVGEEISNADDNALADIAMNGSDWDVRHQAVRNITDEDVLFDIAKNCHDTGIAIEATESITDEDILIDITRSGAYYTVRAFATKYINDKNVLAEIALGDPDDTVRLTAVEKIDDEDVLTEVSRNDSDRDVRLKALRRIRDADKLKKLLLENYGYFSLESFTAFKRNYDNMIYESLGIEIYDDILDNISDESVLAQLVHEKLFGDFRVLTVRRISSGDVLRDLALNDLDYRVRREAITNPNLSDEETFLRIVQTDRNNAVRLEALTQIDNPDLLADIANGIDPLMRTHALERLGRTFEPNRDEVSFKNIDLTSIDKIEDEDVLYAMAINAPSSSIRRYAFERITDENILAKLVCYSREFTNSALNMIDDNELLLNIALYCNDPTAQRKAVKKIDDEEFLLEAVQANPYNDISQYIVDRIRDESRLEIIAFNNSNPFNRKAAVNKIQNPDTLMRLGEIECEEIVCTAIVRKCRDRGLLEYIGLSNPCKTVRRYVGSVVDDDELLYKLALKECEFDNRREMISRISDEKCTAALLKRETSDNVFKGDFGITNPELLIDLARNSISNVAREYAIRNINDIPILTDFICCSPFSSREPEDNSLWKDIRYTRNDMRLCLLILSKSDFSDMQMTEEFLIENDFFMCNELFTVRNKVDDISSIYKIVLNCKSKDVRRVFKYKLEYPEGYSPDDGNEDEEPLGLGALFG